MKLHLQHLTLNLSLAALCGPLSGGAATTDVAIQNFAFSPSSVTIKVGDSVRWTQKDGTRHTTTSNTGLWDSGLLSQGQTFSRTFSSAGSFSYHCTPHQSMTGTIKVAAASNSPPSVTLTSPTNNATFAAGTAITLEATATDPDGTVVRVRFLDGTNLLGVATNAPYRATATLAPGSHTLTADAEDNLGATATSPNVTVSIAAVPIGDPIPGRIAKGDLTIELETVLDGLASPLGMAVPDDASGRWFVYDQAGLVWVVTNASTKLPTPLLDVRGRLVTLGVYDERGLLGLAPHPNFAQHPLVYTFTSEPNAGPADFPAMMPEGKASDHQSVIAEWRLDPAHPNQVDLSSRREILRLGKPQANHNGGAMHFGPDGDLYVAIGDGGNANDVGDGHMPGGNAQDLTMILGKLLRLDVDARSSANGQYGLPADNPFVGRDGLDEIYAFGLRNPWSFSFDRLNGQLYLGDVGQDKVEEVDLVVKGGNYGWNVKEGSFWFDPSSGNVVTTPVRPVPPDLIDPIAEYDHDEGEAVIGGFVYHGHLVPALQGRYVFGDWGTFAGPSGRLFYLAEGNTIKQLRIGLDDRQLGSWIKGFGEDANGELYIFATRLLGPSGNTGKLLRIVPAPLPVTITNIANQGGTNAHLAWSGGTGPFVLQKKSALTDPTWINAGVTVDRQADAPMDGSTGFYRVQDTARLPPIR